MHLPLLPRVRSAAPRAHRAPTGRLDGKDARRGYAYPYAYGYGGESARAKASAQAYRYAYAYTNADAYAA
jgi:hypothetical protein